MATKIIDDNFFTSEQRRFRRLEVQLPIWLAIETEWDRDGRNAWTLGYTRDISVGGCKITVPHGEEGKWKAASEQGSQVVLRFGENDSGQEAVVGKIRRAQHDEEAGTFWIGVEYLPGAEEARRAALNMGLKSMKSRRRWQVLALVVIVVAGFSIFRLSGEVRARETRIAALQKRIKSERQVLGQLLRPQLAGTRAQGIDAAFQSAATRKRINELQRNMSRLSDPRNQNKAQSERAGDRINEGLELSVAPATGAQINLGLALPYGFAWPQVASDLEELIGRRIPTIVIFRDFKSAFPVEDCREARLRAKTLQITWEPWHFSDPKAVTLKNIIAGKHDKYIDSWAQASKSFGNELWIRWGHEFNGNWYPWSISANKQNPKTYIAAFRHVRSRFVRAGALNVKWIWCLNAESVPNTKWNDPVRAYPGDAHVDMIAIDGYNFGNSLSHSRWQSFDEVFAGPYEKVMRNWRNKPLIVGETGCATTGGDKAQWIREMDQSLRKRFRKIQGVVWFEAQKEADWRMASSPDSRVASRNVWRQNYYRRGEP